MLKKKEKKQYTKLNSAGGLGYGKEMLKFLVQLIVVTVLFLCIMSYLLK
jgi:hypothetical protein